MSKYTRGMMLRDALLDIKRQDESFAFRHSCGEGVCGSDGVNVNGTNKLACITAGVGAEGAGRGATRSRDARSSGTWWWT